MMVQVMPGAACRLAVAAAAAFCAVPTHSAEIDDLIGNWGSMPGYDCNGSPGSEVEPVTVERDERGLHAGAYAWQCTVASPEKRGILFGGPSTCASEGNGEIEPGYMQLGITPDGQLLIVDETSVVLLDRCPTKE